MVFATDPDCLYCGMNDDAGAFGGERTAIALQCRWLIRR